MSHDASASAPLASLAEGHSLSATSDLMQRLAQHGIEPDLLQRLAELSSTGQPAMTAAADALP